MGRYFIIITQCVIFLSSLLICAQTKVNIIDFGANGNDDNNDWYALQRAIDFVLNKGGGEVYFPSGTYIIHDRTLLIWGSNIKLIGESKHNTILLRTGRAGWWGELLSISGKSNGGKYYGGFGSKDYKSFLIYKGESTPSKNIQVKDLTLSSLLEYPSQSNNLAIVNSSDVTIDNCVIENAPKSNLAVVNVTTKSKNHNIKIINSEFRNSGQHNVRVISYNQGDVLGNSVQIINSKFINALNVDRTKELKQKKVHLWYRAGLGGDNISLIVDNCFFDKTGEIVGTVNVDNLEIRNSTIESKIDLLANRNYFKDSKVIIQNNSFLKEIQESVRTINVENKVIGANKTLKR